MRVGILSDAHLGFSRYSKVNDKGVNVREDDFYRAFVDAVENLVNAEVDAILDLGDLADNPHPKKRALPVLIETINASGLLWWSVNGNHTLVRHSTDVHLYSLLERYCPRFMGIREAQMPKGLDAFLIPYGTSDEIKAGLELATSALVPPAFIGGHFACNDVLPDGHDITVGDLPRDIPVFLGHFHGRQPGVPYYVGAIERKTWGEAQNPTGVTIFDTDAPDITFIEHRTREWIDLIADPSTYLDVLSEALLGRDDLPIVRLTVAATREEYRNVDELAAHRIAHNALDLQVRRQPTDEDAVAPLEPVEFSLAADWRSQVKDASLPKGVQRAAVEQHGIDALVDAGVAA